MHNQVFQNSTLTERQNKLKRILKSKNPCPSDLHINQILNFIDYNKQYTIIVTSKIEKFKNIIVREHINTSSKFIRSNSTPIYGTFSCGLFQNINGIIHKTASSCHYSLPAAALKKIQEHKENKVIESYHLVIYVPSKNLVNKYSAII